MPLTTRATARPVASPASEAFAGLSGDGLATRAVGRHDDRDAAHGPAAGTREAREAGASRVSNTFRFMKTFTRIRRKLFTKAKAFSITATGRGSHATRTRRGTPATTTARPRRQPGSHDHFPAATRERETTADDPGASRTHRLSG